MRTRFDQFAKQGFTEVLSAAGRVETDAEVCAEVQRIDVLYVRDPNRDAERRALGLVGRMIGSHDVCMFEAFHHAPRIDEVRACIRKQLTLHQMLMLRARHERAPAPKPPLLWLIAAGRPKTAMVQLGMSSMSVWPAGFYEAIPGLRLRLVIANELPKTRETLLLRLMGSSRTMNEAIADLRALPAGAWERNVALGLLRKLRLTSSDDPEIRSDKELEEAMGKLVDEYLEEKRQWRDEAREEGREEGLRSAVVACYEARFGVIPANLRAAIDNVRDPSVLLGWATLVATAPKDSIENTFLGFFRSKLDS